MSSAELGQRLAAARTPAESLEAVMLYLEEYGYMASSEALRAERYSAAVENARFETGKGEYAAGLAEGRSHADAAKRAGFVDGREEGYDEGHADGFSAGVKMCIDAVDGAVARNARECRENDGAGKDHPDFCGPPPGWDNEDDYNYEEDHAQ